MSYLQPYKNLLMRRIVIENKFKRDAKKLFLELVTAEWAEVLSCLCSDSYLPEKYKDHALTGEWKDFRDCHIKPDLILIYTKKNDGFLQLVRLGSHSELFG